MRLLEIAPGRFAHASGALWLPQPRTVLIADAHLGYGWAQRRRGQLGPVRDPVSAEKIFALMDELNPPAVVFLGDVVHAPRPAPVEHASIESVFRRLMSRTAVTVVRGNHDRGLARDFGGLKLSIVDKWRWDDVVAVHGDRLSMDAQHYVILGHLHPALAIEDAAGARQRVPVFLACDRMLILPAFSPFAAGVDVNSALPPALASLNFEAIAATGRRVVRLGPLRASAAGSSGLR